MGFNRWNIATVIAATPTSAICMVMWLTEQVRVLHEIRLGKSKSKHVSISAKVCSENSFWPARAQSVANKKATLQVASGIVLQAVPCLRGLSFRHLGSRLRCSKASLMVSVVPSNLGRVAVAVL